MHCIATAEKREKRTHMIWSTAASLPADFFIKGIVVLQVWQFCIVVALTFVAAFLLQATQPVDFRPSFRRSGLAWLFVGQTLRAFVSFVLMLVAMTFNLWLLVALSVGVGAGAVGLTWARSQFQQTGMITWQLKDENKVSTTEPLLTMGSE